MHAGREDRGDALRACSNMRGGTNFTVDERRLTHPSVFVLARQRPFDPFFVSFRVRRRRLSCLTMRHARRAGRSRRRASSSLELARRHELHGRRTPTDASVSFRARASAPIRATFRRKGDQSLCRACRREAFRQADPFHL